MNKYDDMTYYMKNNSTSFRWASSVFSDKYCQRKLSQVYYPSEKAERAIRVRVKVGALKKYNQNVTNVWWNIQKHKPNETKIKIKMTNNNKNWEVG